MNGRFVTLAAAVGLLGIGCAPDCAAQAQKTTPPVVATSAQPIDTALDAAQALIGRALFLRGFYAGSELSYDATGHVQGQPKQVDWTLAAANIEKVVRRDPGELELDGVRVAIRYNPDQHVFERHPQKDQKLKIVLAVNDDARGLQGALATMFAVGIDPALQRSMPVYWRHYFSPALAWPKDDLSGVQLIPATMSTAGGLEYPVLEKRIEPEFTPEARVDHVKGAALLVMTVGTDGIPRRIWIKQPLGYGLDARAVDTAARLRFRPGTKDGKPVAMEMVLNQTYDYAPPPPAR